MPNFSCKESLQPIHTSLNDLIELQIALLINLTHGVRESPGRTESDLVLQDEAINFVERGMPVHVPPVIFESDQLVVEAVEQTEYLYFVDFSQNLLICMTGALHEFVDDGDHEGILVAQIS